MAKQTVDEILAVMEKRGKLNMEWAMTLAEEVKRLRGVLEWYSKQAIDDDNRAYNALHPEDKR